MKLRRIELALFIALAAAIIVGASDGQSQRLSEKMIRLHVVANSDSEEDQNLKLEVRDEVLKLTSALTEDSAGTEDALDIISDNRTLIEETVLKTVQSRGYNYSVDVNVGVEEFTTRDYQSFSLPAGEYQTLRVTIGNGNGHNWWCVVFPPICMASCAEELSSEAMAAGLDENEIALITGGSEVYILKFKLIELVESIKLMYND